KIQVEEGKARNRPAGADAVQVSPQVVTELQLAGQQHVGERADADLAAADLGQAEPGSELAVELGAFILEVGDVDEEEVVAVLPAAGVLQGQDGAGFRTELI